MEQEELERIKKDVSILDIATRLGYTVKPEGSRFTLKEHDSIKFYPDTNSYNRFSTGRGGDIFAFVMELTDKTFPEAFDFITNGIYSKTNEKSAEAIITKEKEPFVLPKKSDTQKHMFAYLTQTRYLAAELISDCLKKGLIYEDERRNAVFVGHSYENAKEPVFATRRGTGYSDFKRDVKSSDQSVGFRVNFGAEKLFVTEAPIDALSMICIAAEKGIDVNQYNYLALCGVSKEKVLYNFLDHNTNTKQVIFALDNDEAGQKATQKMMNHLKENYPKLKLAHFKFSENDLNDQLKKIKKKKAFKEQTMEV